MKKLYITKVQKKLLLILTLAVILPLAFSGGFALVQIRSETRQRNRQQISAEAQRVDSTLFDLTFSIYTTSESMFPTNTAMHLFAADEVSAEGMQETETINQYVQNYTYSTATCSSIEIYTNNPHVRAERFIHFLSDDSAQDWRRAVGDGQAAWAYLTRETAQDDKERELCLVRKIAVPSQAWHAYLVIRIDNNYLRNVLGESAYGVDAMIKGTAFYSNDFQDVGKKITLPKESSPGASANIQTDGGKLTAVQSFTPYRTDTVLTVLVTDEHGPAHLRNITGLYTIILIIAVGVPILIIALFSRSFSRRVEILRNTMRRVRGGDLEIETEVEGDDELTETFEDLKATVQKIHEREKVYYEARIHEQELKNQQQKMEFKMLASQINPHFLYNTLEMIRMQALSGGNRQVAYSIKLLGKTMHYVLENTGSSLTTLDKELDYVTSYLEIQKLRFGERLNYEMEVGDNVQPDEIRVLPLTLQPIVENAVLHGLADVEEGGVVRIAISRDDGQLVFCVADNGPGMDEAALETVRENLRNHDEENTKSIGLYNIRKRVRLLYGKAADLTVDSFPGRGTVVTLVIPDAFQLLKS